MRGLLRILNHRRDILEPDPSVSFGSKTMEKQTSWSELAPEASSVAAPLSRGPARPKLGILSLSSKAEGATSW